MYLYALTNWVTPNNSLKHSEHLGLLILLFCARLKLIRNACTITNIICGASAGCKNHVCSMGQSYPVSYLFSPDFIVLDLTFLSLEPGLEAQPLGGYLNQYLFSCIFQFTGRSGSIFDLLLQGSCTS